MNRRIMRSSSSSEATLTAARLRWVSVVVGYNRAQLRLLHAVGRIL